MALPVLKILKESGEVITPACTNNQDFNFSHPTFWMKERLPMVYYAGYPANKSGSTGNGSLKEEFLVERFGEDTEFFKAVSLSGIDPNLQKEKLTPLLLDGLRRFRCPRAPETTKEAMLYDMTGLGLGFQLHAMSVTEPYDENVLCSGALNVTGFLYNHFRMAVESGFQLDMTNFGLKQIGDMHEQLGSGVGGLYEAEQRKI